MENIINLPSEIQWNIIKFMRHPVVEMLAEAEAKYEKHLRQMEYHLDGWRPCPPTENRRAYDEMTFLKYLKYELKKRQTVLKILKQLQIEHADNDYDSDDDSDGY